MNSAPSSDQAPAFRWRTWLRRLTWIAGAVLASWALLWVLVPWVVKQQIEKQASAQLGRSVQVGAVEFLPWTLEITLHGLSVAGREDASPQFEVQRIHLNVELESLLRLAPVVESVQIDGPHLRLAVVGPGQYDIDDILQRLSATPAGKASDPFRFAVFNLALRGGMVDVDDRTVSRQHGVRNLQLSVPFLSNLDAHRDIHVEPRLAFDLNGSHFASTAQSKPFSDARTTRASVVVSDVDLAPYLPYLPASLPVRVMHATAGMDLTLEFEQRERPVLNISGSLQWKDVVLHDRADQPLLAFDALRIGLDALRPLDRIVKMGRVEIAGPRLALRRDAQGSLQFLQAVARTTDSPDRAPAPAVVSSASAATGSDGAWEASIAQVAIQGGSLAWADGTVPGVARLWLHDLGLELDDLTWPVRQDGKVRGSFALVDTDPAKSVPPGGQGNIRSARIQFDGTASDHSADVQVSIRQMQASLADAYLAQFLVPALRGQLEGDVRVQWADTGTKLVVSELRIDNVELVGRDAKAPAPLAAVRKATLSDAVVDLSRRSVQVGKLAIVQPRLALSRAADGRWMYEPWLREPSRASGGVSATAAGKAATAADGSWALQMKGLTLDGGELRFEDRAPVRPVVLALSSLQVQMSDWELDGKRLAPLRVSASIQAAQAGAGQLQYEGQLQMEPLATQGKMTLTRLPVHAFEPYFADRLNIELLRADTSFRGLVRYASTLRGMQLRVEGDTSIDEFRANSLAVIGSGLPVAEELLNWKSLLLGGLLLDIQPDKAPAMTVRQTSLSDFYARLIIFENGRINLQDLVKAEGTQPPAAGPATTSAPVAAAAPPPVPAASTPTQAAADPLAPVIQFGPVSLINGRVLFSDRFVKPNYSADLSDLTGRLGAFSSVAPQTQPQMADLELRGRAEGTASLEITGKLNPLAQPLALDIQGKVRDLELPPLSTYSVKYAGHGIQRGKLSLDVAYRIQPDGQLTATNKLVLNQLAFGDPVQGAPNSLPVRLAVALLADRNGVIDIDLPVSGSLNDPQFSVGPIIFKAIVNLVVKAITAPFSLLASVLGGESDQLSRVSFAPGSAALSPDARAGLDKVAKALRDRPALRMTVVGSADLEREREAFRREQLQSLLVAEKRRQLLARGAQADQVGAALAVGDEERPALLKEVFQRAEITKPRNAAGVLLDVAMPDMEALLLTNIPVSEEAMRELAVRRGVVVKDYLAAQDLPVERLFLGAPKPDATGDRWVPHAELNLGTN